MKHFKWPTTILFFMGLHALLTACGQRNVEQRAPNSPQLMKASISEPLVKHGFVVDLGSAPRTYPLVVVKPTEGKGLCTLTAIGPRVLLTAAHCVAAIEPDQRVTKILLGGIQTAVQCQHLPGYRTLRKIGGTWAVNNDYPRDPSADIALCRVDTVRPDGTYLPGNARFEMVDTRDENKWLTQKAIIAGYGPTADSQEHASGQLTAGEVIIQQSSTMPGHPRAPVPQVYADCSDPKSLVCSKHMLILVDDKNDDKMQSILPGDSGGAVYILNGNILQLDQSVKLPADRRVVGVNVKLPAYNIQSSYSFVAALGNKQFRDWASGWAISQGQGGEPLLICGINSKETESKCKDQGTDGPTM